MSYVIIVGAIIMVVSVGIVYPIIFLLYKGREVKITIVDKWVTIPAYIGDSERCVIAYCNHRGKPRKGKIAYCPEFVYEELEKGRTYVVIKKFKVIEGVREQHDL